MRPKKLKPTTLRAYAERRGVSAVAVTKAIAAGRLVKSVITVDGQPKIADPELADREWEENTRPRVDVPIAPARRTPTPSDDEGEGDMPDGVPDYMVSRARREAAAARREAAQADLAELDVAERRGELVRVDQVRADVIDKFTIVKTRIMGVPSRVAQRMPHLASEVVPLLDALLREALEELATDRDDEDSDDHDDEDGDDHDDDTDDTDDAA